MRFSPIFIIIIIFFFFFALLSISTQSRVAAVAIGLTRSSGSLRTPGSATSYSSACANEEGAVLIGFKDGTKKGVVKISVVSQESLDLAIIGSVGFSVSHNAWCSQAYAKPFSFWTASSSVQRVVTTTGDMRLDGYVDFKTSLFALTCSISTGYCYTCSSSSSSPGKVYRFNMATLAYNSQTDVITLSSTEIDLKSAVISGDYLYVAGGSGEQMTTTKATVTKINLVTWQKEGIASGLTNGRDKKPWTLLADEAGEFLFMGCDTWPAGITRIRISTFALEDAIEITAAERGSRGMIMDAAGNIYLGGTVSGKVTVFGATTSPTFAPMTGTLALDYGSFGPCIVQTGPHAAISTWNQQYEAADGATVWRITGLAPYSYTTISSTTTTSSTTTVTSTTTTTFTSTSTTHPPTAPPRTQTKLPSRSESLTESENIGLSVTHLLPPTPSSSRSLARSNTSHRVSESSSLSHHPLSSTIDHGAVSPSRTKTKTPDDYFFQQTASALESTGVSSAVAAAGILAMNPASAVGMSRLRRIRALTEACGTATKIAVPDLASSPFQLVIGDAHDDFSLLRGQAVGNALFIVAYLAVFYSFAALVSGLLGRSFDKGKRMARAPGIVAIPILTLAADTASSISTLLTFGEKTMRDLTAAVVGGSVLIVAPVAFYCYLCVVTQSLDLEAVPGSPEFDAYVESLKEEDADEVMENDDTSSVGASGDDHEEGKDEEERRPQRTRRASIANSITSRKSNRAASAIGVLSPAAASSAVFVSAAEEANSSAGNPTLLMRIRRVCAWTLDPVSIQWVNCRFVQSHGKWFDMSSSSFFALLDLLTSITCGVAQGTTNGPAPPGRCRSVAILSVAGFSLYVVLLAVWRPYLGRYDRLITAVNGTLALVMSALLLAFYQGRAEEANKGIEAVTLVAVAVGFLSLWVIVDVVVTAWDLFQYISDKRAERREKEAAKLRRAGAEEDDDGGRSSPLLLQRRHTLRKSFRLENLAEDDEQELMMPARTFSPRDVAATMSPREIVAQRRREEDAKKRKKEAEKRAEEEKQQKRLAHLRGETASGAPSARSGSATSARRTGASGTRRSKVKLHDI